MRDCPKCGGHLKYDQYEEDDWSKVNWYYCTSCETRCNDEEHVKVDPERLNQVLKDFTCQLNTTAHPAKSKRPTLHLRPAS